MIKSLSPQYQAIPEKNVTRLLLLFRTIFQNNMLPVQKFQCMMVQLCIKDLSHVHQQLITIHRAMLYELTFL